MEEIRVFLYIGCAYPQNYTGKFEKKYPAD